MKHWTKTARAAFLLAAASITLHSISPLRAQSASASGTQRSGQVADSDVQSRGVVVLRPTATPTPQPTPQPTPTPKPGPTPVVIKDCPRPFAHRDVVLEGGDAFDRKLSKLLRARKATVIVDLPTPYPVDGTPPAPLVPWIAEVKSSGGIVKVDSYCQASRGLFGNFLKRLFGGGTAAKRYAAANGYDAVLHLNGLDQRVTQIQFVLQGAK